MKLYFNPASPFVRKVRMVAEAKNLSEKIELIDCVLTPVNPDENVIQDNPLGKIPALYSENIGWLYDSRVICEYLDQFGSGAILFPATGIDRWSTLRFQSVGDGICDAAILVRYERFVRSENEQSEVWVSGQMEKVQRGLSWLEQQVSELKNRTDIGAIALACALGYLDFRIPDLGWRESNPQLANTFEQLKTLPGFSATSPD
ncbi:MAG: glutathione S-transferase [Parasphingorhabdus sp.]|jgi:glutathione S-transferase